ncbi:hypothetical protein QN277_015346 [Acacia crassicarpa]|uniref:Uncharacterized protein n=1 Tax=Acacia crassicarpa TaxID=499986 RepID=A0AAE1JU10_9FABA|nr:hypothetical protein QN277_015346 [Acacia crassicarpa]
MGRRILDDNLSLSLKLHPVLYLSFVALGVVASIAIITSLCSILTFWKKPSSKKQGTNLPAPAAQEPQAEEEAPVKEVPLPPAMQYQGNESYVSVNLKRAASERKMSLSSLSKKFSRTLSAARMERSLSSLSKKLPRTLSAARMGRDHLMMRGTHQKEDSVWMKTIILGEKCQVPEDEEEAVIYEKKGKKVEAYHPRTKSSMSFSNISSISIDADELPPQRVTQ